MAGSRMRVIIAGGRDYVATAADFDALDRLQASLGIAEVVSGGARGVDVAGEAWARMRDVPVKRFPADWRAHGKAAGFRRNQQMADYADALIAFPGGRGTADMIRRAEAKGIPVYRVPPTPALRKDGT